MELPVLYNDLNASYGLDLPVAGSMEELGRLLAEKINVMIRCNFDGLVQLLYRVDVSESRVRQLLKENTGVEAGTVIARLILDRVWEKIQTRKAYTTPRQPFQPGDEERW